HERRAARPPFRRPDPGRGRAHGDRPLQERPDHRRRRHPPRDRPAPGRAALPGRGLSGGSPQPPASTSPADAGDRGGVTTAERSVPTQELDRVTIRFAGDSGDGMQLTGTQFTRTAALFGNDISTFPDYPAEIRAPAGSLPGVSGFQLSFSSNDIHT